MYEFKNNVNTIIGDTMDIKEALSIIPRCLVSIVTLLIATKILGKKQVSQLSLFDYVIGISIGNFTAEMILVLDTQLLNGIVAILTFGIIGYIISFLTVKSIYLRRFFSGTPTTIIEDGKILVKALKKVNIDINDLLEQARNEGYFNIEDISYAVMEINGKISFLPKDNVSLIKKKDLNIKKEKEIFPINIIIDSKLMKENIKNSDKSITWLKNELKKQGYTSYKDILLATYYNNTLKVYKKNQNINPKNTQE